MKRKPVDPMTIRLTPVQAEAFRVIAERDSHVAKAIASRPETESQMLLRIRTKTQAKAVDRNIRMMVNNLITDADRTGPDVKMAYALQRHDDSIREHFHM